MSESTSDVAAPAAPEVPVARVRTVWRGDRRFETGRDGLPTATLDGDAVAGQSPMDALLSSLAACSGIDVVDILAKRRTPVERFEIRVEGRRRPVMPKRFVALRLEYHVTGAGIEAEHAERAVALAFEKYCSAAASLAPDMQVETVLVLNGTAREPVAQRIPG
jgi:putative redox protein